MFEHLNAHEGVESVLEFGWDVPIVHQVNSYTALETGDPDSLFCEKFLFDG